MLEVVTKLPGSQLEPISQQLQEVITKALQQNFSSIKSSTQVGVGYSLDIIFNDRATRVLFTEALPTVIGITNDSLRDHLSAIVVGSLCDLEPNQQAFEPLYLAVDGPVIMGEALKFHNKWVSDTKSKLDAHLSRDKLQVQPKLPILRRVPDLAQEQLSSEMKFIHTPSGNVVEVWVSNDPAKLAAEHAKEIIDNNPNPAVLGLPTGKTPIALYNRFIELVGQGWTGLNNVIGVQLDEYFGVSKFNSQSFYRFLEEQFFTQLPKESNAVHLTPADEDRIAKYDAKIEQLGGMLICFLGIGTNGHVAFNEPSKKLESDSQSRLVTLSPDTRIANFGGAELGYPQAITIGLKSILASKNIFLIANSENKIKALKGMLKEQSNPLNPASLLVGHTGLKIYVTPQIYNDLS